MEIGRIWDEHKGLVIVALVIIIAYLVVGGGDLASFGAVQSSKVMLSERVAGDFGFVDESEGYRYYSPSQSIEPGAFPEEERRERKTASIQLEAKTSEYDRTKQELEDIMNRFGGFYTAKNERSTTYGERDYRTYSFTFKVPVDSFETAIEQVTKAAKLKHMQINADDLTAQYVDAKAYLDTYKAERQRVMALLNKAETIDEIIKVEQRLTELQRLIDSYQRQVTNIERQTDFSQISVTLQEELPASQAITQFSGIKQLFRNAIKSFDSVFVVLSKLIGWIIFLLIIYGIYKGFKAVFGRS